MTETRQRQIDPESLSRMNAAKVTSLQDIFVNCMKGKVALVSGGASGLVYMVVSRLCEAGAKVVIASRGEARAQRALEDFKAKGYEVSWVQTDVSKVASCYEAVDYIPMAGWMCWSPVRQGGPAIPIWICRRMCTTGSWIQI